MLDILKKHFTVNALIGLLNRLPPLNTPIMDLIYPEAVRFNHPFDRLSVSDLGLPAKNIPLVTRGSVSYSIKPDKTTLKQIEPANIAPSDVVDASDLNRLKTLGFAQQQQFVENKINEFRNRVRLTTEAMATQSITGKINYDIRTADGNKDKYEVNFGTPETVTLDKKWDANDAKAQHIVAGVGKIIESMQKTSLGADIVHLINWDVYSALVGISAALNNPELIKVFEKHIQIGTAKFILCAAQYHDYKTDTNVSAIPAKTVISIARDDAFKLAYCALDSVEANFAAMPFFVRQIKTDDPEGIKLIAQSRPMPIPNVAAIRKTQVLA
jgi:hypothetical protein